MGMKAVDRIRCFHCLLISLHALIVSAIMEQSAEASVPAGHWPLLMAAETFH